MHSDRSTNTDAQYLINISTQAVHMWQLPDSQNLMTYGVTKNSGTLLHQIIADETPAEKMQIVSVHPGTIFTEVWENYGVDRTYLPFDDSKCSVLPSRYIKK